MISLFFFFASSITSKITKVKVLAIGFFINRGVNPLNHYPVFANYFISFNKCLYFRLYVFWIPEVCILARISSKGWVTAVDIMPLITPAVNLFRPLYFNSS